ncbi:S1C family serine protease [Propionicimonas sp.]|uniref:S1C family serine protease n=1 Tax=Propionicimonas sp. TaxID=1955623 RepID=UPI0039E5B54F
MSLFDELADLVRVPGDAARAGVVTIGSRGRGTGVIVAPNRVLTNAHNLRDRTTQVRFADGRTVQASAAGEDVDGDLVVLEVDTAGIPALPWADEPPGLGDVVLAVTAGRHRPRVTWGQVTATEVGFTGPRGRPVRGAIEHTAPCAPGSSGAPVLDRAGRVVAINTHRLDYGFYLARTVDAALRQSVAAMAAGRTYEPVRLGVALAPTHVAARLRAAVGLSEQDGLLVRDVAEGSPAARASIRSGDLLVRAGEQQLRVPEDLYGVLAALGEGDQLVLAVVRGAAELTITVTF